MAKKIIGITAGLMLAGAALQASADTLTLGDAAKGKKLHDAKCTGCHVQMHGGDGSMIYTRKDRKISSLEGLIGRVELCNRQTQAGFSPEELHHVTSYLNQTYYKF